MIPARSVMSIGDESWLISGERDELHHFECRQARPKKRLAIRQGLSGCEDVASPIVKSGHSLHKQFASRFQNVDKRLPCLGLRLKKMWSGIADMVEKLHSRSKQVA